MTLDPSKLLRVYPESTSSYRVNRGSLDPNVTRAIIMTAAHDVYEGEAEPYPVPSPTTTLRHSENVIATMRATKKTA